ncbi:MAG: type II secretion system F family protein, partial [Planctomycetota bacterium]|nr:type II secretion system F family protein [Planctomycetota bacterium]
SGQMGEVLSRMSGLLRAQMRLRSTVTTAVAYPVVLTFVSCIVLAALMFFVLPQFGQIFEDMEIPAPMTTQLLLNVSEQLRTNGLFWGAGFAGVLLLFIRLLKTDRFRWFIDRKLLYGALIREVVRSLLVGRTFRLMATMLESGVPLLESIRLCRQSVENRLYRDLFDRLENEVLNGRGIGHTLSSTEFVPSGAAQMVNTAERTGRLGSVMHMIGEFYEEEGERSVQELSKLLEPIIIVLMGVIVAFIVASVMLPMLSFSTAGR